MQELSDTWFPHHLNGEITPLAQARLYPYPAPNVDYWMRDGIPHLIPNGIAGDDLTGRTAVLSVGSNRAPLQLRRKFGPNATLPVTRCQLLDADIVFASTLSFYCASPATACPSRGTVVDLNITWLDDCQLLTMHETEAVGIAYDYVKLDSAIIDHTAGMTIDRLQHPAFDVPVFGYQSRASLLDLGSGAVAHARIASSGRVFVEMTEEDVLQEIKHLVSGKGTLDDWILAMRRHRSYRLEVMERMAEFAIECPDGPWTVLDIKAERPDDFL